MSELNMPPRSSSRSRSNRAPRSARRSPLQAGLGHASGQNEGMREPLCSARTIHRSCQLYIALQAFLTDHRLAPPSAQPHSHSQPHLCLPCLPGGPSPRSGRSGPPPPPPPPPPEGFCAHKRGGGGMAAVSDMTAVRAGQHACVHRRVHGGSWQQAAEGRVQSTACANSTRAVAHSQG